MKVEFQGYRDLTGFIREVNQAVIGVRTSDSVSIPAASSSLLGIFDVLKGWVSECSSTSDGRGEETDGSGFLKWHTLLLKNSGPFLEGVLPTELHPALVEVSAYLVDSFGFPDEVEYGVGNEAAFLTFLMCLYRIGYLDVEDLKAIALRIFVEYLKLCRMLQELYNLKPANKSQFAIDDYQFVPYIWGSAQLIGNELNLVPESYADRTTVEKYAGDYLILDAVKYIFEKKSGEFHEHSQELWNITAIHTWERLNNGLLRMYEAEVLQKFNVVRRFRFGSLFSFERRDDAPQEAGYITDEDSDLID